MSLLYNTLRAGENHKGRIDVESTIILNRFEIYIDFAAEKVILASPISDKSGKGAL